MVRQFLFLEPVSLSVLSQHRVEAPYGVAGGAVGSLGRQVVTRSDGAEQELNGIDGCEIEPGDRLRLETPGGGGWGAEEIEGTE